MTENEAQRLFLEILDYAESVDEHVTRDEVASGLRALAMEIEGGEYAC